MKTPLALTAALISFGVFASSATAQDSHQEFASADAVKWGAGPPSLPPGSQMAILTGDPTKKGPFTIRLKFPDGYKIPAHQHPTYETVTVISGVANIGMGDKFDEAKAKELKEGGFVNLPANMNHFAFAIGETVVQINSEEPFDIKYVNPSDDPRKTN